MPEETTVPHSHYVAVAESLEKVMEENAHLKHVNQALRESVKEIEQVLIDARFAPVIEEQGACVKSHPARHIRTLVEYNKQVERVRDCLRKELERKGYTEKQLRALISEAI